MPFIRRLSALILPVTPLAFAIADPWLAPGDLALRHDIEVLADSGVLRGPINSWPLSWPDIARDVLDDSRSSTLDGASQAALVRVRREAQRAMRSREMQKHLRVSGAQEPMFLRTFSATPREEGELETGIDWTGDRFATRLQATVAVDPDDGHDLRPDGSYVGANVGNFMISAGFVDRWWGPGWEGSLILSNSARPIPALTLERNYSDPFKSRWLSWIGPWRASIVFGQLEGERTDFDDVRFLGMRASFRPLPQLEIGLSRTAQWCGEGRSCDLETFGDLFLGKDNDQTPGEQPGNQLAGYDARWAFRSVPLSLYAQYIGEDEANGLPSKFLGLGGIETWGDSSWGQWRAHVEYADTSCSFSRSDPEFDCAYEHGTFTQGYRFRGRGIGHTLDSDGRMLSFGALLIDSRDDVWELLIRNVELNRDAVTPEPGHTLAPLATDLTNLEISHRRDLVAGKLRLGIGFDEYDAASASVEGSETRGFVQWTSEF